MKTILAILLTASSLWADETNKYVPCYNPTNEALPMLTTNMLGGFNATNGLFAASRNITIDPTFTGDINVGGTAYRVAAITNITYKLKEVKP